MERERLFIHTFKNPYDVACALGEYFDRCYEKHVMEGRNTFRFIIYGVVKVDIDDDNVSLKTVRVIDDYIGNIDYVEDSRSRCLNSYMCKLIDEYGFGVESPLMCIQSESIIKK